MIITIVTDVEIRNRKSVKARTAFSLLKQTFHLATASRHMIFSGNLLLVNCASSDIAGPLPLFTVLMSDLILLTRPDPETQALHIIEEPIALHDIVGCNFLDVHRKYRLH